MGDVRPTIRVVVGEIGMDLPDLCFDLADLDHALVRKAQEVPEHEAAGSADVILCLRDRRWYKVKIANYRGGATFLNAGDFGDDDTVPHEWWLGIAGVRQGDSRHQDFYETLRADTSEFLPVKDDWLRLKLEAVGRAKVASQRLVRRAAYKSMMSGGKIIEFQLGGTSAVRTRIRVEGDCAYLSLGGVGIISPEHYVLILSAFPEIDPDDWQPEPTQPLWIQPEDAEIVYSTIVPFELQRSLMDEFNDSDEG